MIWPVLKPLTFERIKRPHVPYLMMISTFGFLAVTLGLSEVGHHTNPMQLLLLVVFASVAEISAPIIRIGKSKVAYEVGTAVSLAAVPFYGPAAGSLIIGISGICYWLYKYHGIPFRQRRFDQLIFNIGMRGTAIFIAGTFLANHLKMNELSGLYLIFPVWVTTAIMLDQINIWLLIGMLWLRREKEFQPINFWLENRWAMVLNISINALGGFALATAVSQLGILGIMVFFLPIGLSTFAFQLYTRQMQAHMDNLEHIIADRTKELANLLNEKDSFLTVLTHDMKTPLTSINLYASLLLQKPELAVEKPRMIETILRSQNSLTNIVNDILDIEKLQTNSTWHMEIEPLNVVTLLSATVETLRPQADNKMIHLLYREPQNEICIKADQGQIERVFQNVISNGIKYTPNKGYVEVTIKAEGDFARIDVTDTGYGIPQEELPHIFERFRRVEKHKDKATGTGLGLAVTKALVESHDGEIEVVSEEGKGTIFTLKLPLASRHPGTN